MRASDDITQILGELAVSASRGICSDLHRHRVETRVVTVCVTSQESLDLFRVGHVLIVVLLPSGSDGEGECLDFSSRSVTPLPPDLTSASTRSIRFSGPLIVVRFPWTVTSARLEP